MSEANEVKNVTSDLIQPTIEEQHIEQMPWGTLFTQLRKDGWNYAVMLVRKYNDFILPEGLGDLAAALNDKGYMILIVVDPGDDFDFEMADCGAFESDPCINLTNTIADFGPDRTTRALYQLKNTRLKVLPPYFNLSTPELEAEFISDCFTDMYLKVDEMIYYKKNYETPWYAQRQYIWVD